MFQLEYTLTRPFPGRWFAPVAFTCALISIAMLTTLNVALTGYETVTVFRADFNATQKHWFDRWIPSRAPKPGTLCDQHVFNVGDSFTTNYTLFQWVIESVNKANAGDSGVSYQGSTLEGCDIASLYLNGDMHLLTVDVTAVVTCRVVGEFEVNAKTSFSMSSLPGKHSPLLGVVRSDSSQFSTPIGDPRGAVLDAMTQTAAQDVGNRMAFVLASTNNTSPVVLSIQADFPWCPASLGPTASCAVDKPLFNISNAAVIFPNTSLLQYSAYFPVGVDNPQVITEDNSTPLANLIQTVYAAIRIDLGNPSPNNFLLNSSVVNNTLFPTFPQTANAPANTSLLYLSRTQPVLIGLEAFIPLNVTGPANLQIVYPCRFQRPKELGSGFISVLVATLSMFSSGWAILIFVATFFVKRDPLTNRCDGCSGYHAAPGGAGVGTMSSYRLSRGIGEKDYDPVSA